MKLSYWYHNHSEKMNLTKFWAQYSLNRIYFTKRITKKYWSFANRFVFYKKNNEINEEILKLSYKYYRLEKIIGNQEVLFLTVGEGRTEVLAESCFFKKWFDLIWIEGIRTHGNNEKFYSLDFLKNFFKFIYFLAIFCKSLEAIIFQ